ncbi:MAG: permease, partial [Acidothermaceae bacterium]
MSVDQPRLSHPPARATMPAPPRQVIAAAIGFAVIAACGLLWAKWDPYSHKVAHLFTTRSWAGHSILDSAGTASASPSWHGAWSFARSYGEAVWMALAAALVIAAAVEALVPRHRIVSLLSGRSTFAGTAVAGLLAVPCMMCTCCSAPIAATLRRRGVPTSSVLGYWIGNPVLNPAVLVFLALVAPWQWVATRIVIGGLLVFAVVPLLARFTNREPAGTRNADVSDDDFALREAPARFVKTLLRLVFTLVPEYFVVVLAIGAFRGWLFPLGANAAHWGIVAIIVATVAGT